MPKITTCILVGKEVHINEALDMKQATQRRRESAPNFKCPECKEALRPMRGLRNPAQAHFEHVQRNPKCSLSSSL